VPHHGTAVVDYDLLSNSSTVADSSGNGFDARRDGALVKTPLGSFGPPYTFRIVASTPTTPSPNAMQTLLSGPDDAFLIASTTLAFVSSNITYLLANFTLPAAWTEITVSAMESGTVAFVDGTRAGEFRVAIDETETTVPMAFVAPLAEIGEGVGRFTLVDDVVDVGSLSTLF
jgi:hexosaminidase